MVRSKGGRTAMVRVATFGGRTPEEMGGVSSGFGFDNGML